MNTAPSPAVVVGADGSSAAAEALGWAVAEARRRSVPLRVVHALDQRHSGAFVLANPLYVAAERLAAQEVLDAAVDSVRDLDPGLDVQPVLEVGPSDAVLLAEAATAGVVVVGSRGRGGFAGLLLGSTSLKVALQAPCPVVVVRCAAGTARAGRVVVGTDCSPGSEGALRFAFERARDHGLGLTVVHAGRPTDLLTPSLAPWRARYAGVDVVEKSVAGNAGGVLVAESAGAEILVVGSRGRSGVGRLLLGSVSHAALHHAHCPVAVVRQ